MKFGSSVLQVNKHQLTESDFRLVVTLEDGGHDIISHRILLPPGEYTLHMQLLLHHKMFLYVGPGL